MTQALEGQPGGLGQLDGPPLPIVMHNTETLDRATGLLGISLPGSWVRDLYDISAAEPDVVAPNELEEILAERGEALEPDASYTGLALRRHTDGSGDYWRVSAFTTSGRYVSGEKPNFLTIEVPAGDIIPDLGAELLPVLAGQEIVGGEPNRDEPLILRNTFSRVESVGEPFQEALPRYSLTPTDFERLQDERSVNLVDIRKPEESAADPVLGAVTATITEVIATSGNLPNLLGRPIIEGAPTVIICNSGSGTTVALQVLHNRDAEITGILFHISGGVRALRQAS